MSNAIQQEFGRPRVFLPVIHTPSLESSRAAVAVAVEAGADGVVLINQGLSVRDILYELLPVLREAHPGLWVGLNALGCSVEGAVALAAHHGLRGIWSDDAGVDHRSQQERLSAAREYTRERKRTGWTGLYFGGTAFKTQAVVPQVQLAETAKAAARFMEVVTSSGRGTGVAADLPKVKALREAIGEHALALASGITPENVGAFLPYVDAYLVATGIEKRFGVLDPVRTKALADAIHGYVPCGG